jgi:hypothetical protein
MGMRSGSLFFQEYCENYRVPWPAFALLLYCSTALLGDRLKKLVMEVFLMKAVNSK